MKHTRICDVLIFLTMLAIVTSCKGVKKYSFEFKDQSSNLVATGAITLPRELATDRVNAGSFVISLTELGVSSTNRNVGVLKEILGKQSKGPIEVRYATEGRFIGKSQLAVDFCPNANDRNVQVFASFDQAGIKGAWYLALFEGGTKGGDFLAREKP